MTPTKLLIGQIISVFAIVLAGVWFATQWVAAELAYQPELGRPWLIAFGRPIYLPWALFGWWFSFEAYAPTQFEEAGAIAAASGLVGCTAAIFGSVWRARQQNNLTTYGSARWADAGDIRRAGLLTESGVFLGRTGPRYLRHDGPEHIMAFAPTRSGKGVGLVVPTLLGWSGSAVIHDIKGENWQLTAGWRQRFSHCLLFNPTDARSARYNPLLEVRLGTDEVRDVQNIADILVDPEGALERRNHWEKTSHSLLVGAILHILYAEEDKTLARVASFLSDPQRPFTDTLRRMMTDNGIQFADQPHNRNTAWSRQMRFDMICEANDIEHRLTKPNHPWTNGKVERMNRTIKEATVKRFHYESHDQLRTHLADFIDAYTFARRLKTLSGLTPYEYIAKIWTSEPDRFILNPIHQMPGLNT